MAIHNATELVPLTSQSKLTVSVTLNLTLTVTVTIALTLSLNILNRVHIVDTCKNVHY